MQQQPLPQVARSPRSNLLSRHSAQHARLPPRVDELVSSLSWLPAGPPGLVGSIFVIARFSTFCCQELGPPPAHRFALAANKGTRAADRWADS